MIRPTFDDFKTYILDQGSENGIIIDSVRSNMEKIHGK